MTFALASSPFPHRPAIGGAPTFFLYALLLSPYALHFTAFRDWEVAPTFLFCRRGFLTPIKFSQRGRCSYHLSSCKAEALPYDLRLIYPVECAVILSGRPTVYSLRPAKGGAPTS